MKAVATINDTANTINILSKEYTAYSRHFCFSDLSSPIAVVLLLPLPSAVLVLLVDACADDDDEEEVGAAADEEF